MVVATKKSAAKKPAGSSNTAVLKPIKRTFVTMKIVGTSPLIQHQWSEKPLKMMRDKHAGKKTRNREVRDPEKEGNDASYRTQKGGFGIPAMALKSAIITAAHRDIGIEKTLVRKSLFLQCNDPGGVLAMECEEPVIKEDHVRVGQGATDLRYRPYFYSWALIFTVEMDASGLQLGDLITLIDRAGFGVGIGEWRPEKGGESGRFRIDETFKMEVKG